MRPFTVLDCAQRSDEWMAARRGRLTGSAAAAMVAAIKSGEAAARRDLRTRLVLERLTDRSLESEYLNADMQWGIDHEADALAAYESLTGDLVTRTGFLQHVDLMAGCSLDGHLGDFDVLVSIKCPRSANHLANLKAAGFPASYLPQASHELWIVPSAKEYHFLSFDPRFPDALRTCFVRRKREDFALAEYEQKALAFLREVDVELEAMHTLANLEGTLHQAVASR